jgi:hypothetical protein
MEDLNQKLLSFSKLLSQSSYSEKDLINLTEILKILRIDVTKKANQVLYNYKLLLRKQRKKKEKLFKINKEKWKFIGFGRKLDRK